MRTTSSLVPLLFALLCPAAPATPQSGVPYSTTADWESYPGGVTTGGAFVDIDGDGFLDLLVANGNDILRQHLEVYLNDGAGGYSTNPDWQSADIDYNGHIAVGDVDRDGWPDVAVAVFLGPAGFGDPGHVKLYRNLGGTLESTPSWRSSDSFASFAVDFGDADGDGDLDLAVAVGEPYYGSPEANRIYYNQNGTLDTVPGWTSPPDHAMGVAFGDADGDGDLDLAFCTAKGPMRVYFQGPGGMATTPGWESTDNTNQNGNSVAWADTDGDGYLELGVSDNDQLGGGAGVYKIYDNGPGGLATTPMWSSYVGYVSAMAFADLQLDGRPDLAGGAWWGGTRIYLGGSGGFPTSPDWLSSSASVVESLFFGDLDNLALRAVSAESHAGNGIARVFYLDHSPARTITGVRADGMALPRSAWCADPTAGWIALDQAPAAVLEVDYLYSEELDMGVTNWDQSIGNLVFLRSPRVEVTILPTGPSIVHPGDSVPFDVTLTSTTARNENPRLAVVAFPPVGGYLLLDLHDEALAPFGGTTLSYTPGVPLSLPPGFFGAYEMAAAVLENGIPVAQDRFPFTIQ